MEFEEGSGDVLVILADKEGTIQPGWVESIDRFSYYALGGSYKFRGKVSDGPCSVAEQAAAVSTGTCSY